MSDITELTKYICEAARHLRGVAMQGQVKKYNHYAEGFVCESRYMLMICASDMLALSDRADEETKDRLQKNSEIARQIFQLCGEDYRSDDADSLSTFLSKLESVIPDQLLQNTTPTLEGREELNEWWKHGNRLIQDRYFEMSFAQMQQWVDSSPKFSPSISYLSQSSRNADNQLELAQLQGPPLEDDERTPSRTFLYVHLAGVEDHLDRAKKAINDVEEIMKKQQRDLQDEFIAATQSLKSIDDEYTGAGGKSFLGV